MNAVLLPDLVTYVAASWGLWDQWRPGAELLIDWRYGEHGWEMLVLAIQPDHIDLFVRGVAGRQRRWGGERMQGHRVLSSPQGVAHLLKLPPFGRARTSGLPLAM
jgi:hypothetical protein